MALYLFQGNYSAASMKALIDNPHDRSDAIGKLFEAAGGKLLHYFLALGESDWITIAELPDNVTAAAVSMTVSQAGSLTNCRATPLLTPAQAVAAMTTAKSLTFIPPTQGRGAA